MPSFSPYGGESLNLELQPLTLLFLLLGAVHPLGFGIAIETVYLQCGAPYANGTNLIALLAT
jgi:hypothetical protein